MQGNILLTGSTSTAIIKRLAYLISGYLHGILHSSEFNELEEWLQQSVQNQLLFAELLLPYNIRAERLSYTDRNIN